MFEEHEEGKMCEGCNNYQRGVVKTRRGKWLCAECR